MYIERLQVEPEGFLGGLDVHFTPGLNVLVGARGTGKTSIIELIRYALGADAFTKSAADRGRQQAEAILEGGSVTVTIRDGDTEIRAHRSSGSPVSAFQGSTVNCTVLGQNEIEAVGAQKSGRMHLVDRFRHNRNVDDLKLAQLRSVVSSATQEIVDARREIDELKDLTSAGAELRHQLEAARESQASLLQDSQASQGDRDALQKLQTDLQAIGSRVVFIEEQEKQALQAQGKAAEILVSIHNNPSPQLVGGEPILQLAAGRRAAVINSLEETVRLTSAWVSEVETEKEATAALRADVDQRSRDLRQSLELVQAGASQAARIVADLEERVGQVDATNARLRGRMEQLQAVVAERDAALDQLEMLREQIFVERTEVTTALNAQLGPVIKVDLFKSAGVEEYRAAIVDGLRGSGLHYNSLAPRIAETVAPYELVRFIETKDNETFAAIVGLTPERAAVVLDSLSSSAPALIAVQVPDEVELKLLDGHDYKPSDRLSIGQRCTAVLPLLLGHSGDPLLLDQPEDHLDNAFVADTLVASLAARPSDVQYIFSSHNANIPVLGEADNVIVLTSDGESGHLSASGGLDDSEIVEAIERIMEGGAQAFEKRASFYSIASTS